VPNVLRGVEKVDLSVTVMGQKLALPVYCSWLRQTFTKPAKGSPGVLACV